MRASRAPSTPLSSALRFSEACIAVRRPQFCALAIGSLSPPSSPTSHSLHRQCCFIVPSINNGDEELGARKPHALCSVYSVSQLGVLGGRSRVLGLARGKPVSQPRISMRNAHSASLSLSTTSCEASVVRYRITMQ